MKKTVIYILFNIVLSLNLFSQSNLPDNYEIILDGEALTVEKVTEMSNEVFANCMMYSSPEHISLYKRELSHLKIIHLENDAFPNDYLQFSDFSLKNKCNPSLTRDTEITASQFNPLKYHFGYNPKQITYIRFNDTNTFFVILP